MRQVKPFFGTKIFFILFVIALAESNGASVAWARTALVVGASPMGLTSAILLALEHPQPRTQDLLHSKFEVVVLGRENFGTDLLEHFLNPSDYYQD